MKKILFTTLLSLIASLFLSSAFIQAAELDKIGDTITGRQLLNLIESGQPPLILDVRTAREYKRGHVPGAINIHFRSDFGQYPVLMDKPEQPVVVYCAYGPRAMWAEKKLKEAGMTRLISLKRHFAGWSRDKLPIER